MSTATTKVAPAVLTRDELAAYLRVSRRQIDRLASAGELPPAIRVGRRRRWTRKSIDEMLARQEQN